MNIHPDRLSKRSTMNKPVRADSCSGAFDKGESPDQQGVKLPIGNGVRNL
jgi:hypothetical protein